MARRAHAGGHADIEERRSDAGPRRSEDRSAAVAGGRSRSRWGRPPNPRPGRTPAAPGDRGAAQDGDRGARLAPAAPGDGGCSPGGHRRAGLAPAAPGDRGAAGQGPGAPGSPDPRPAPRLDRAAVGGAQQRSGQAARAQGLQGGREPGSCSGATRSPRTPASTMAHRQGCSARNYLNLAGPASPYRKAKMPDPPAWFATSMFFSLHAAVRFLTNVGGDDSPATITRSRLRDDPPRARQRARSGGVPRSVWIRRAGDPERAAERTHAMAKLATGVQGYTLREDIVRRERRSCCSRRGSRT